MTPEREGVNMIVGAGSMISILIEIGAMTVSAIEILVDRGIMILGADEDHDLVRGSDPEIMIGTGKLHK